MDKQKAKRLKSQISFWKLSWHHSTNIPDLIHQHWLWNQPWCQLSSLEAEKKTTTRKTKRDQTQEVPSYFVYANRWVKFNSILHAFMFPIRFYVFVHSGNQMLNVWIEKKQAEIIPFDGISEQNWTEQNRRIVCTLTTVQKII